MQLRGKVLVTSSTVITDNNDLLLSYQILNLSVTPGKIKREYNNVLLP